MQHLKKLSQLKRREIEATDSESARKTVGCFCRTRTG